MPESDPNEYVKLLKKLGMLTFLPVILVSGPLAGFFIAKAFERFLGTGTGVTFIFISIGFLAGARESYRLLKRVSSEK